MQGVGNSYDRISGTVKAGLNGMPVLGRNGGGDASAELAKTQAELVAELRRTNELLAANNAATQANTGAAKTTKPVGGALSNAEEKY